MEGGEELSTGTGVAVWVGVQKQGDRYESKRIE